MNPFVLFMSIRSVLRLMFSKDPEIVRQRKETEEWAENSIKRPFIEGLEGIKPEPKPKDYLAAKIFITWLLIIVSAVIASQWFGW